jgi:hypothetical protein
MQRDTLFFPNLTIILPTCATRIPAICYGKCAGPVVGPTCGTLIYVKTCGRNEFSYDQAERARAIVLRFVNDADLFRGSNVRNSIHSGFLGNQVRGRTTRHGDRGGKSGNSEYRRLSEFCSRPGRWRFLVGFETVSDCHQVRRRSQRNHHGQRFGSVLLSIMTDFTDLGKEAGEPAPVRVLRMIVRKLFLELHGIIGLKRSSRPIP